MQEFDSRYREVEFKQTNLKQKLVEFNNFIKEKQAKVKDCKHQMKTAKKLQMEKLEVLKILNEQKDIHQKSLNLLLQNIESKSIFVAFLKKVVEKNPEVFVNIDTMLDKNSALIDMKNNLKTLLSTIKMQIEDLERNLGDFKEGKMKETLVFNIKLGR